MAHEFTTTFQGAGNLYAIVRRVSDGYVWNVATGAWVVWADGSIDSYDVAMTNEGGDFYTADCPTDIAADTEIFITFYERSGATPAITDYIIGRQSGRYVGTAVGTVTSGNRTRSQLETNVRRLLREATAKEHSADAIYYALDNAIAEVWDDLAGLPMVGYCTVVSTPVNIVADTDEYAIPTNMVHVQTVQVRANATTTSWLDLDPAGPRQWQDDGRPFSQGGTPLWTFTLIKATVLLKPTPTGAITSGLRFIGTENAPTLSTAGSTSGMPAVLDGILEQLAAALLLLTEGNKMAAAFEGRARKQLDARMTRLARRHEGPRTMNRE